MYLWVFAEYIFDNIPKYILHCLNHNVSVINGALYSIMENKNTIS